MKIARNTFNLDLFTKHKDEYIYQENLDNHFYCVIKIIKDELVVKVYDSNTFEEYIPFNIKNNIGVFSSELHRKVDLIIDKLKINNNLIVDDVFYYIKTKYQILPEYPFNNDKTSATFKKNGKWFLLYMNVNSRVLGINDIKKINIINIKLESQEIETLIDNIVFFKAYHMNKKYWITINLDNVSDISEIKEYIDKSFNLV